MTSFSINYSGLHKLILYYAENAKNDLPQTTSYYVKKCTSFKEMIPFLDTLNHLDASFIEDLAILKLKPYFSGNLSTTIKNLQKVPDIDSLISRLQGVPLIKLPFLNVEADPLISSIDYALQSVKDSFSSQVLFLLLYCSRTAYGVSSSTSRLYSELLPDFSDLFHHDLILRPMSSVNLVIANLLQCSEEDVANHRDNPLNTLKALSSEYSINFDYSKLFQLCINYADAYNKVKDALNVILTKWDTIEAVDKELSTILQLSILPRDVQLRVKSMIYTIQIRNGAPTFDSTLPQFMRDLCRTISQRHDFYNLTVGNLYCNLVDRCPPTDDSVIKSLWGTDVPIINSDIIAIIESLTEILIEIPPSNDVIRSFDLDKIYNYSVTDAPSRAEQTPVQTLMDVLNVSEERAEALLRRAGGDFDLAIELRFAQASE